MPINKTFKKEEKENRNLNLLPNYDEKNKETLNTENDNKINLNQTYDISDISVIDIKKYLMKPVVLDNSGVGVDFGLNKKYEILNEKNSENQTNSKANINNSSIIDIPRLNYKEIYDYNMKNDSEEEEE